VYVHILPCCNTAHHVPQSGTHLVDEAVDGAVGRVLVCGRHMGAGLGAESREWLLLDDDNVEWAMGGRRGGHVVAWCMPTARSLDGGVDRLDRVRMRFEQLLE